jgi:putative RecB family exonuclease
MTVSPAPGIRPLLPVVGSLSPSRASDFKTCPLLYRFRSIDRLPQRPTQAATRGTLVHAVLERLFDLAQGERTPEAAAALVGPEWERLLVAEREQLVEVVLESGLRLRGFVDRLDVAPSGDIRVVDYKTGAAPREAFEGKALFQLKFYALVIWRTRGVVPRQLRLLYLGDREVLDYTPDSDELVRFERTVQAVWAAIDRARAARDFRPNRSRLCDWCDHQALCPEFGGTPPPFPEDAPALTDEPATSPAAED